MAATLTTLKQIRLHRDDLVLVKEWKPEGLTPSGLWTQHEDSLPAIYADVILAKPDSGVRPGDFVLFARYAGEPALIDGRTYHFVHKDDIEAIIDLEAEGEI
jgi:co-chaperonin GroES (HSP10)